MEYEEAFKILEKENINLDEFEESEEYNFLRFKLGIKWPKYLVGFPVTIDGNVEQILIYGKNEMQLTITYSLRPDMLCPEQLASIIITDEKHKQYIRKNIKPNTRLKCIAKYNDSTITTTFNLVSIIDSNSEMKFGHYICPKCNYDYGKHKYHNDCHFCEDDIKLNYINNFYTES